VLPGKYSISLSADGGKSDIALNQLLEIRMDPRVKTSPDDLRRQFELDRKIADALHRDYQAVKQVRTLRSQLKSLTERKPGAEIVKTIAALEAKAAALEGDEGGYGTRFLSAPEGRSLARLNAGLGAVLSALDSADAAPTTQQSAMFGDLEKALGEQLTNWEQMKSKDVRELNPQLSKAGLPVIDLQKPAAGSAGSEQTTTQDRDRDVE